MNTRSHPVVERRQINSASEAPRQPASRWTDCVAKVNSVRHPRIPVTLEFEQIVGWVLKHERAVHLGGPVEAGGHVPKELDLAQLREVVEQVEVPLIEERDAEVARVERDRPIARFGLGQVADDLVAKEVERDPVWIRTRQLASELCDVEVPRVFQVRDRDREMEQVVSHPSPSSNSVNVSARSPSRSVSSARTPDGGTLPRLTSGPTRRTM